MLLDPTAIGRYTVQRALGRGAMGVVWLATDPLLKRPVAIKTLLNPAADDVATIMERFRREAEISARLNHPNVITVFDVGSDPKVGPFLAMEFIEGASLAFLARKGMLPETTLRLLIQGMAGLMAAGEAGIVHRDVKPENMLVGKDGRLKLMDFGIARANESHLTQAGMVFGTPSYTAPELLRGLEASPVTDQYAFVVTCLEALTGKLPFLGNSVAATLYKVVHEPPDLPPDLDPAVRDVFLRALAKESADRYPDLPSFMRALVDAVPMAEGARARLASILQGDEPAHTAMSLPMPASGTPAKGLPRPPGPAPSPDPAASAKDDWSIDFADPEPEAAPAKRFGGLRVPKVALGAAAVAVLAVGGWFAWGAFVGPSYPLIIHSDPAGATVFLNGKPIGKTPIEDFPVREGRSPGVLRFELEGYTPQQVPVEADIKAVDCTLKRPGTPMALATDPPGAEVLLDGAVAGHTPMEVEVPATGAKVTLRLAGYAEHTLDLKPGTPPPGTVALVADQFKVAVISEPSGAEVFLDAMPVGETPLPALEVKGTKVHSLRLKKAGYKDKYELVEPGKPLPNPLRLERK